MNGNTETERQTAAVGLKHVQQNIPIEFHAFELDGRVFIARDVPEATVSLYVVSARSRNVRTFVRADAMLYEGKLVTPHFDQDLKTVEFYHDYAGRVGRRHVEEWLDEPAFRLKKLQPEDAETLLGGVGDE